MTVIDNWVEAPEVEGLTPIDYADIVPGDVVMRVTATRSEASPPYVGYGESVYKNVWKYGQIAGSDFADYPGKHRWYIIEKAP